MSAFLCNPVHIGQLAAFVRRDPHARYKSAELAETFARANLASVAARYHQGVDAVAREFGESSAEAYVRACVVESEQPCRLSPVEAIKALHCLDYQACEVAGWEGSTPAWRVREVLSIACHALAGYEAAAWEISAERSPRLVRVLA